MSPPSKAVVYIFLPEIITLYQRSGIVFLSRGSVNKTDGVFGDKWGTINTG